MGGEGGPIIVTQFAIWIHGFLVFKASLCFIEFNLIVTRLRIGAGQGTTTGQN